MARERPQVIVIRQGGDHGCLISILLIVAWPLANLYWLLRLMACIVGSTFDWRTGGPLRRRSR